MKHFRNLFFMCLMCGCTAISWGQIVGTGEHARLSLASDSMKVANVHVIVRSGVLYVPVDELARFLAAKTSVNTVLKKVELVLPSIRIKCSDESPFVIMSRQVDGSQSVHQLGAPVVFTEGEFAVPAVEFLRLYESGTKQKIMISFQRSKEGKEQTQFSTVESQRVQKTDVVEKNSQPVVQTDSASAAHSPFSKKEGIENIQQSVVQADSASDGNSPLPKDDLVENNQQSVEQTDGAEDTDTPAQKTDPVSKNRMHVRPTDSGAKNQQASARTNAERQKRKWKLDVVVLDAGHGGHDPGTIGSKGTWEKNVTLGIALKLGKLIEKNLRGVKVVYTRSNDTFVELYRRGQIANEAGGKLFISIHCNSTPTKATAANGFEIYLLRPGKTETAIEIAEQENGVIRLEKDFEYRYQKLTDENYIILTMAQSAYVKQSERFAEFLEMEMAKKMVYQSRGVKQAGFYVLVGASMPNVLIEAGYLSNYRDEKLLRGLAGQYLAAQSIFDGLKKFKTEYERNFMDD